MAARRATTRGFTRSATLLQDRIKAASSSRGFEQSRLLTQWAETVGEETAAIARPVKVSYTRGGFGATLTLLTTGPNAPMLEMQKEKLREKVNAVYGYNAISRIVLTQTAPTGFSEGQASFAHKPKDHRPKPPSPETVAEAARIAAPVGDDGLRAALEALATNVLSKPKR
ncbi:MAG: DciA family protein [Roseovarius sp.]